MRAPRLGELDHLGRRGQLPHAVGALDGTADPQVADGQDVRPLELDMGDPVRIIDLARRMIELSGLAVKDAPDDDGDIEIVTIGLRPGEKLYEELLIGENPEPTMHARIMKANERFVPWPVLEQGLGALHEAMDRSDVVAMRAQLGSLVPEFRPEQHVVDWVYQREARG